jgi:Zn finger protein HypA/HybF involved in hydrogenase expression
MTTDAVGTVMRIPDPIAKAQEYIREKTEFLFDMARCHYCRSFYPANLETGYECPGCGAYEFDIERTVKR